ncbi:MAG: hypothetical protein Terrestrivirus4_7 [Terrestrivirus sp.]|uniref:Uncharacterized protein n=1 Tax=Terrestrivirus sp. TaxID=2487775 RepID=A0A3G4ZRA5_9VIRU|nr:MAG: hypothetical protein Terrestrivirus4_7 [Terrestrivirus sp.]
MASKQKTPQQTKPAAPAPSNGKVVVPAKTQNQKGQVQQAQASAPVANQNKKAPQVQAQVAPVQPAQNHQVVHQNQVKDERTKLTAKANLSLNVMSFRSWLRKYYEQNGMTLPKFRGVHVALTAVSEVLCRAILEATMKHLGKDASGLYSITRPSIRYAVLLDSDLKLMFESALESYDKTMAFTDHFCIPQKEMMKFIETEMGKNIQLDAVAYNLLAYLLAKAVIDFARASHILMTYAGKASLDFNVVRHVIKLKCSGSLENTLTRHVEDTEKLFVPDEEEQQVEAVNDQEGVQESAEQVPNKKKGGKAPQVPEEIEAEADEEVVVDAEDVGEEQEAQAEPEPEPVVEAPKQEKKKPVVKRSGK